jgi:DNA repair protein RAD5
MARFLEHNSDGSAKFAASVANQLKLQQRRLSSGGGSSSAGGGGDGSGDGSATTSPTSVEAAASTLSATPVTTLARTCPDKADCEVLECSICLEEPDDPVVLPCLHIGCQECFVEVIAKLHYCPVCRKRTTTADAVRVNLSQRTSPPPSK